MPDLLLVRAETDLDGLRQLRDSAVLPEHLYHHQGFLETPIFSELLDANPRAVFGCVKAEFYDKNII